ncbi:MAG: DUF1330 domain-containing protein [Solirubrobacteraceae bacterium]
MSHYAVGFTTVTDPSWVGAYLAEVHTMVERHGGRYLSRTGEIAALEGDAPQTVVIIEWPSEEAARAFYDSDEYRAHREARIAGGENQFLLVPGGDAFRSA